MFGWGFFGLFLIIIIGKDFKNEWAGSRWDMMLKTMWYLPQTASWKREKLCSTRTKEKRADEAH